MRDCLTPADFERYDGGILPSEESEEVREHLTACDACRLAYDRHKQDQDFLADAKTALAPDAESLARSSSGGSTATHRLPARVPDIDGYEIVDVLGQGGMGIVYRAIQEKLNRMVALKVLPAIVGAASPSAVSRFRREANAAARLHHTHIVPIYDFGESHDAYYYAMELISGQPLNVVIKDLAERDAATSSPAKLAELLIDITSEGFSLPPVPGSGSSFSSDPSSVSAGGSSGRGRMYYQQVARWVGDAAEALHYAHGQGIIHRDVKPANLILSTDGRIMIADFGLAKSVDEESVTITGSLLGTVRYLSPEQAMARRIPVDHRTDIYSLGATMYELLCFRPAYPGTDDKQVLSAIITREPTAPRKIAPSVPHELETICLKALEKSQELRYATARSFAEDLRRYTHDLPIVAKRPGPIARTVKFVRRHRVPSIAVATVLVFATVATLVVRSSRLDRTKAVAEKLLAEQDQAIADAQRIQAEKNQAIAAAKGLQAEVNRLVETAKRKQKAREYEGARRDYEEALLLDSNHEAVLGNLGRLYKAQYNYERYGDTALLTQAMNYTDRALEIKPEHPGLQSQKGVLLKMLGRLDEAREFYQRAIGLDEDNSAAWENLGVVHALGGQMDEALESLTRATDLVGTDKARCVYPWRSLASLQLSQSNPQATRSIANALVCTGDDAWSTLIRARLRLGLEDAGSLRGAELDSDFALRFLKANGVAYGRLAHRIHALVLLKGGHYDEAMTYASEAIKRGDMETINRLVIATCDARRGRYPAARRALDMAVAAWPADLRNKGESRVTAPLGVLWIESADELLAMRAEAESLLVAAAP